MPDEPNETIEAEARRKGWKPLEEFRGSPENFVDAETFVRIADESLPHAKGTMKMMDKRMRDQEVLIRQQNDTIESLRKDMTDFVAFSRQGEERAYQRALKELQAKQRLAVESGDVQAFDAASKDLDALITEHPAVTGKAPGIGADIGVRKPKTFEDEYREWMMAEPNAFDDWKVDNPWIAQDPDMHEYAQRMDSFLQSRDGFAKPRSQRLAEITQLVKKKFPDYFGNPARRGGSPVEGDTGGGPGGNGRRSYNELPPDAKKQCDKWTGKDGKGQSGTIPGLTREDFVRDYKW